MKIAGNSIYLNPMTQSHSPSIACMHKKHASVFLVSVDLASPIANKSLDIVSFLRVVLRQQ